MANSGRNRNVSPSGSYQSSSTDRHVLRRYIAATFENWLHYVVRSVDATNLRAWPDKEPSLVDGHDSSGDRYRYRPYPHHHSGCHIVGQSYRFQGVRWRSLHYTFVDAHLAASQDRQRAERLDSLDCQHLYVYLCLSSNETQQKFFKGLLTR